MLKLLAADQNDGELLIFDDLNDQFKDNFNHIYNYFNNNEYKLYDVINALNFLCIIHNYLFEYSLSCRNY